MNLKNKRDGDGFLIDNSTWTKEVMIGMMADDLVEISEEMEMYIDKAREMYDIAGTVPAIRHFAKEFGMSRNAKELYRVFKKAPMKQIAKYGGLPKPTGCV